MTSYTIGYHLLPLSSDPFMFHTSIAFKYRFIKVQVLPFGRFFAHEWYQWSVPYSQTLGQTVSSRSAATCGWLNRLVLPQPSKDFTCFTFVRDLLQPWVSQLRVSTVWGLVRWQRLIGCLNYLWTLHLVCCLLNVEACLILLETCFSRFLTCLASSPYRWGK